MIGLFLLLLIFNMVSIDRHSLHKDKFLGSSLIFKALKGFLKPKGWESVLYLILISSVDFLDMSLSVF